MKIEIKGNSTLYNLNYGDKILIINDEEVTKGTIKNILEKLNKIIEAWF